MAKPTRWSYSSISTYQECPAKWKYSYVDNLPWPTSPAAARGTRLHALCEGYVLGSLGRVPSELMKIGRRLEEFKNNGGKAEDTWMLDTAWQPTKSQSEAWIKAIVDVHYLAENNEVLHLCDYKSGQPYPSHRKQLELYGLIGLQIYPEVKRVEYSALYIDSGYTGAEGSIIRPMFNKLKDDWHNVAVEMMETEIYPPKPSLGSCKWCPYSSKKGGPCDSGV